jgi:hypothetical protein
MNEMNELWISPWRKMQESLAIEFEGESSRGGCATGEVATGVTGTVVPAASWLVRARSREVRMLRAKQ